MRYRILFWLILSIGVLVRMYHTLSAPYSYANSDTCTIWLMATHILKGEFPLFFYGQYYLGPMEALTIALFWLIFGMKVSTLYLGNIFYSALFIISGYFLGKELRDRISGLMVMLYLAIPPVYFFADSIAPLGYHIEILFLGNLIFVLSLRAVNKPPGFTKSLNLILIGICAGLGIWAHYIILYYLLPAFLYLLINERWKVILKNAAPVLLSFFLIGLPFWIFTFRYNFATFKFRVQSPPPQAFIKFIRILFIHLGEMFDIRINYSSMAGIAALLVFLFYVFSLLYFLIKALFKKRLIFSNDSIILYLLISLIIIYVGYRTKMSAGEGYNYILPVLTLVSTIAGIFGRDILRWNRAIGLIIIFFITAFNTLNIGRALYIRKQMSDSYKINIYEKIKFLEENRIYRFIGHEAFSRISVFFSREKIIAAAYIDTGYRRYEDIVEASNTIGYEEYGCDWRPVLDNICSGYEYKNGFYYNFRPHPYKTKAITHDNWQAFTYNMIPARYAFDRNMDDLWYSGKAKKTGQYLTIDLGRNYRICKMVFLNPRSPMNYPNGCKIEVSVDGNMWEEVSCISDIEPIFWSGPRPYWRLADGRLEFFMEPRDTRFVRFIQIGEDKENPIEINEIFIYEYLDEEKKIIRDYVKDIRDIIIFLNKKDINFIYADFWPSAKIMELSKNSIHALQPYNSFLPLRKNMSRKIRLDRDRAFLVSNEDISEFEDVIKEIELPVQKKMFRRYTCYYFNDLQERYKTMQSLYWIGIGMVKHSLKDYSNWLYNQGEYVKALRYYKNNFLAYSRCRILPWTMFYPEREKSISFKNGVRFLGYSVRNKKVVLGKTIRIEYFWEVHGELKDELSMFVHFMLGDKIIFQNDHRLLYQYARPLKPLAGERFREVLKLKIPEDIRPGAYKIVIGLWDKNTNKRISTMDKVSKVEIGELIISNEA